MHRSPHDVIGAIAEAACAIASAVNTFFGDPDASS